MDRVTSATQRNATGNRVLQALPPRQREIMRRLGDVFAGSGEHLALVGGVVRDALLELPIGHDLDFSTSALPEVTKRLGVEAGAASVYDIGERFGTIGLVFSSIEDDQPPIDAEVTTYRSEHYPNETRHPDVQLGGRLEDDLARRDFTINAIAMDVATGALLDPFDGESDLHLSRIRAVGNPDERFAEDPLRLLRAARFVSQLGFLIESETAAAMKRHAPSLRRISRERVWSEMTKLLTGPYASFGLEALLEANLLTEAMPQLLHFADDILRPAGPHREKDLWDHTKRVVDRAPNRPAVRWAALLHDAAKPQTRTVDPLGDVHFFGHERAGAALARSLLTALKADRATQSAVVRLVELHYRPATYELDWTDSAVRRLMLDAGDELIDLLDLAAADVTSAREHKQIAAAARIDALRKHIGRLESERALSDYKSPLDGEALMRIFERQPGRWIATIKDRLRELVIDGELEPDDVAGATAIARAIIDQEQM